MKYLFIMLLVLGTGCANFKNKNVLPPSVSTAQVVASLQETKSELELAGENNTKVANNIEKAITLAERLEKLLEQIEVETSSKNVIEKE